MGSAVSSKKKEEPGKEEKPLVLEKSNSFNHGSSDKKKRPSDVAMSSAPEPMSPMGPKKVRRKNVDDGDSESTTEGSMVMNLISQALTDLFFLGSAMFVSLNMVTTKFLEEQFREGDLVVKEGDVGEKLYVIVSGKVCIYKNFDDPAKRVQVATAVQGDVLGELALFYGTRREATVQAATKLVAWSITHDEFKSLAAVADARSLSKRAVNLRSSPTFAHLTRRQVYALARAMHVVPDLDPGASLQLPGFYPTEETGAKPSENTGDGDGDDQSEAPQTIEEEKTLFLIEDGSLWLTPEHGTPRELFDVVFPDGAASMLVTVSEDKITCDAGVLLGAMHLKKVTANFRCVAGEKGCRGHAITTATLEAHVGEINRDLAVTHSIDDDEENVHEVFAIPPKKEDFSLEKVLGQGAYGYVVRATVAEHVKTKREIPKQVALKLMAKAHVIDKGQLKHVIDERRLLAKLKHACIMELYDAFVDDKALYLVGEYIDGPDLWSVIYEPRVVGYTDGKLRDASDDLLRSYCACLVGAIDHIHHHGIVYRDLKPENVMVSSRTGYLKVVDFGFAKLLPYYTTTTTTEEGFHPTTNLHAHFKAYTLCGTAEYLSPEMISNKDGYDWCADMWALGCLFYELAVGATPFSESHADEDAVVMRRILQTKRKAILPPFRLARRKFLCQIVLALLKFDPTERLAADELKRHPALSEIAWDTIDQLDASHELPWKPLPRDETSFDDDAEEPKKDFDFPHYDGDSTIFRPFL